jgi:CheY-like chemotaxis protein
MMLLIVDDNAQVRRVIRRICQDLAEEFCECANGAEALAAYRAQQPDWVVMDVSMEVMDGLTATQHILAAFPAARIVITTQFDDAEMREAARQAGACAYVPKDDLRALRQTLTTSGTTVQQAKQADSA